MSTKLLAAALLEYNFYLVKQQYNYDLSTQPGLKIFDNMSKIPWLFRMLKETQNVPENTTVYPYFVC